MKLTNYKIYNIAQQLLESFQDSKQYLPIKLNFFIQKNKKNLAALAQGIEESRIEIIQHYGILNEETGNYTIPADKVKTANKEINDLFSIEQEVEISTVRIEDIPEDISLTTGQMEAIMFMID